VKTNTNKKTPSSSATLVKL